MSSIHNQPECLIPPNGVCLNPPRLFNVNVKIVSILMDAPIRKREL